MDAGRAAPFICVRLRMLLSSGACTYVRMTVYAQQPLLRPHHDSVMHNNHCHVRTPPHFEVAMATEAMRSYHSMSLCYALSPPLHVHARTHTHSHTHTHVHTHIHA